MAMTAMKMMEAPKKMCIVPMKTVTQTRPLKDCGSEVDITAAVAEAVVMRRTTRVTTKLICWAAVVARVVGVAREGLRRCLRLDANIDIIRQSISSNRKRRVSLSRS